MSGPKITHHVASASGRLRHVFVRDLEIVALIGIYDHEKVKPQRIIVNIDLSVHETEGPIRDDISHVVSYEIIAKKVEAKGDAPACELSMAKEDISYAMTDGKLSLKQVVGDSVILMNLEAIPLDAVKNTEKK